MDPQHWFVVGHIGTCGRENRTICRVCALALMGVAGPTCGRQARLYSVLKWAWPAYGGGVAYLWWVWLVLPVEGRQGWTLF